MTVDLPIDELRAGEWLGFQRVGDDLVKVVVGRAGSGILEGRRCVPLAGLRGDVVGVATLEAMEEFRAADVVIQSDRVADAAS